MADAKRTAAGAQDETALDPSVVAALSRLAELALAPGDLELLVGKMRDYLAVTEASLPDEAADVDPIVTFDPRWR